MLKLDASPYLQKVFIVLAHRYKNLLTLFKKLTTHIYEDYQLPKYINIPFPLFLELKFACNRCRTGVEVSRCK